tara:strand:- start:9839 stop:10735 length:897 start_codon:yes stop_codon:yes gene_type:complete
MSANKATTATVQPTKAKIVRKTTKRKSPTPPPAEKPSDGLFSDSEEDGTTDPEVSEQDMTTDQTDSGEEEVSDAPSETEYDLLWIYPKGKEREKVHKDNKQLKALGATNEEVNKMLNRVQLGALLDSRALLVHQAYTTDTREDKSSRSAKSAFNITLKCSPMMLDTIQQHLRDSDGEEYHAESIKEALKHYFYRKWDILLAMEAIGSYHYKTTKDGHMVPEFLNTDKWKYDVPTEFLGGWFTTEEAKSIMDTQQLLHKNSREAKRKAKGQQSRAQVKKDILASLTKEEIAELFKASNQ